MDIAEMLKKYKRIAVVGLSRDETKYSSIVAKFMQERGYKIIPVNPVADQLLGEKAYKDIGSLDIGFDMADVFRPSEEALEVTKAAIGKGAKAVWLQEGIESEDARKYAESKGVLFIQNRCIMKEYMAAFGDQ